MLANPNLCDVRRLQLKSLFIAAVLILSFFVGTNRAEAQLCSQGCVTTHGYDNSGDNVNPNESVLQASTISPTLLSASSRSDLLGVVYAQPLYLSQVMINSVPKNVTYVATEENYVYAYDESNFTGTPLWSSNLNNTSVNESAIPDSQLPGACSNITPEVGITGTPVIDIAPSPDPILYVVSKHYYVDGQGISHFAQRLNALDVTTGTAVYPALDIATAFQGLTSVSFEAANENQRAGLALSYDANNNPLIWVTWGSHCDAGTYTGLIALFTVENSQLTLLAVYDNGVNPGMEDNGGIWMAGAAPVIDDEGLTPTNDVYFVTGNGRVNPKSGLFGESVLGLNYSSGTTFTNVGFYTPNSWKILNGGSGLNCPPQNVVALPAPETGTACLPGDLDLGSGGAILARPTGISLQYMKKPENFVVVAGGKEGIVYVNSPLRMAANRSPDPQNPAVAACSTSGANSAVQCLGAAWLPSNCCVGVHDFGVRGGAAFWAGPDPVHGNLLYVAGVQDTAIRAYQMDSTQTSGQFKTTPFGLGNWKGSQNAIINYPGSVPVVTWNANGGTNAYQDAILWITNEANYQRIGPSQQYLSRTIGLYAYYAEPDGSGTINLTSFVDTTNGPGATKFMEPTVINGHVYLAGQQPNVYCSTAPCFGAITMWAPTGSK
jgi:hypothetical protein